MKHYKSLREVRKDIASGEVSLDSLVQHYLNNVEANREINAFLEVFAVEAMERASEIQLKINAGNAGKLAGMVLAIKDNICYKGHKVSASSRILENFESLYSSTVVERLLKEDVIIIGRLNCDEFAMGGSNENSAFGPVLNPLDHKLVPGGSSGGSAAAVAAECCLAALGSDTGGSIRQPASLCGVIGLKPSYGRVSRYGLIAFASSFDQIGPITHSVEDAAILLEVMAGTDEFDSTVSKKPVPSYSETIGGNGEGKKYKIAVLTDCFDSPGLDPEIKDRTHEIMSRLREMGHDVEDVEMQELKYMVPAYYMLTTAEASSNLSRYDGIHYGYRSKNVEGIDNTYLKSRSEGFGEEVKRRIMLGTFVLSAGYYDDHYAKAQKVRRIIKEKTEAIFSEYDFILLPTTPTTAFALGEKIDDPVTMYLEDVFTVHANLAGIPAISLPLGKHSNGMPFGIQLMSRAFSEEKLLQAANTIMNTFSFKN